MSTAAQPSMVISRKKHHLQVKEMIAHGKYVDGLRLAESTINNYGPHIGLRCDLVCCQYQLGLFAECRNNITIIENDLFKLTAELSRESIFKTLIFVAKIYEEMASVAESLALLQKAYPFADDQEQLLNLDIQFVRLQSYFGIKNGLAEKAKRLIVKDLGLSDIKIELLHGALWSEYCLFGYQSAAKVMELLTSWPLAFNDQRLIHRDFLEISILNQKFDHPLAEQSFHILSHLQTKTVFDMYLIDKKSGCEELMDYFFNCDLSTMQKIRILLIEIKTAKDPFILQELRRRFNFIIDDLSPETKAILEKLLPRSKAEKDVELKIETNWLSKTHLNILRLFQNEDFVTLDFASKSLWQEAYQENHYDRIRMQIYKLNKIIEQRTTYDLVNVTKQGLQLKRKFTIDF